MSTILRRFQNVNLSFDLGIAALFATFGLWATVSGVLPRIMWLSLGVMIVAIIVRRVSPDLGLALGWVSALTQIWTEQDVSFLQFGTAILVFTAVAHGSRALMIVAAVSVFLAGIIAVAYLIPLGSWTWYYLPPTGGFRRRIVIYGLLPLSLLGATWLAGLASRLLRERQAQAVAREAAGMRRRSPDRRRKSPTASGYAARVDLFYFWLGPAGASGLVDRLLHSGGSFTVRHFNTDRYITLCCDASTAFYTA